MEVKCAPCPKDRPYTIKNGKQDGLVTEWYKNGKISEERIYKSGKYVSKIQWDEKGKIKKY